MEIVRRLVGTGTLATVALAGALGAGRPPVLAATDRPWQPPQCGEARAGDVPIGVETGTAWYRLDPRLDESGSLAGQRLTIGLVGGLTRHLDLAPESFASGPVDGVVLVGEDDGTASRLRLLDVSRECETDVGREARAVVRGALLTPDGSAVWEHRVNRVTRVDEGVWRRPVAGGPSARVLPGLPEDGRFGPTFVTELSWAADGRLGVSSCGERVCRTRVMDPSTGRVDAFEGTGPLVGVHEDRAVVHGACAGLPCPIEAVDLGTGRRTVLVEEAGLASVDGSGAGSLVFEAAAGRLTVLDLGTGRRSTVDADDGLVPMRRTSAATSGAETPGGAVLIAPRGR
ncbi:MAG: hypothetical protein MUQ32_16525, partial [Chloroflexi bacterium]|nr:hypothetical protein [Chloroflexota bacterium]